MNWKSIRLELGQTEDFPNGSVSRAYLLRLPVDDDGRIDEEAVGRHPEQATARRLWPSEPDLSGRIRRRGSRWAFEARGRIICELDAVPPLAEGALLTVREGDGRPLPFRVAKLYAIG